jgi:hypothetical protein
MVGSVDTIDIKGSIQISFCHSELRKNLIIEFTVSARGTTKPSPVAQAKTAYITRCFGDHGYGIVSGLAQGIDRYDGSQGRN